MWEKKGVLGKKQQNLEKLSFLYENEKTGDQIYVFLLKHMLLA